MSSIPVFDGASFDPGVKFIDVQYSLLSTTETSVTTNEGGFLNFSLSGWLDTADRVYYVKGDSASAQNTDLDPGVDDFSSGAFENFNADFSSTPPFDPWQNAGHGLSPSAPQGPPGGVGSVGQGGLNQEPLLPSTSGLGNRSEPVLQSNSQQALDNDAAKSPSESLAGHLSRIKGRANGTMKLGVPNDGLAREADTVLNLKRTSALEADSETFDNQETSQSINASGPNTPDGPAFPQSSGRHQPLPLAMALGSFGQDFVGATEGGAVDVTVAVSQTQQAHEDHMYAAVAAVLEEHGVADAPAPPDQLPLEGELARAMALEMVFDEGESAFAPTGDHSRIDVKALAAPPEGVPVSNVDKGRESDETSVLGSGPGPIMLRAAVGAAIVAWHRCPRPEDQQEPSRHSRFSSSL